MSNKSNYLLGLLFEIGVTIMLILPYFITVPDFLIYITIISAFAGVIFLIMGGGNTVSSQSLQASSSSVAPVKEVLVVHTSPKQQSDQVNSPQLLHENRSISGSTSMPSLTTASNNLRKDEFMAKIIKLSEIVQSCQDLVENETELTNREDSRLYLKRREFKALFMDIKSAPFDSI